MQPALVTSTNAACGRDLTKPDLLERLTTLVFVACITADVQLMHILCSVM